LHSTEYIEEEIDITLLWEVRESLKLKKNLKMLRCTEIYIEF